MKKSYSFFIFAALLSLCVLFLPAFASAAETDTKVITLTNGGPLQQTCTTVVGEKVTVAFPISAGEEITIQIPAGVSTSITQLLTDYGHSFTSSDTANAVDNYNQQRSITLTGIADATIQWVMYPMKSGSHRLSLISNSREYQVLLQTSTASVLRNDLMTGKIAPLSLLDSYNQLARSIAPPSLSANVDLTEYFKFNGNAYVDPTYTNVAVPVIPLAQHSLSTMWSKYKIDLTKDFSIAMYVYMHNPDDTILADGFTLTFQNNASGLDTIGLSGGNMGIYARPNALSVEFDPYLNNDAATSSDYGMTSNHIAIIKSDEPNPKNHSLYGAPITNLDFNVDRWRWVRLTWDAEQQKIDTVYYEIDSVGNPTTIVGDISTNTIDYETLFGSNEVYWGFTASTGGRTGIYYMAMSELPIVNYGETTKALRNVTEGESFSTDTVGQVGDIVEYKLTFNNTSGSLLTKLKISDLLQSSATALVPDSTVYTKYSSTDTVISTGPVADSNWTGNQLDFSIDQVSLNERIEITFQVKLETASTPSETVENDFSFASFEGINNQSKTTTLLVHSHRELTIHYLDTDGTTIKASDTLTIPYNSNYTDYFPVIDGYSGNSYQVDGSPEVPAHEGDSVELKNMIDDQVITYVYSKLMTVHVRQLIKTPHAELLVPTQGFVDLLNGTSEFHLSVNSNIESETVAFSDHVLLLQDTTKPLGFHLTVPSYYNDIGYIATATQGAQATNTIRTGDYQHDVYADGYTLWITFYIEPTISASETPTPYSWDYKKNILGTISIE